MKKTNENNKIITATILLFVLTFIFSILLMSKNKKTLEEIPENKFLKGVLAVNTNKSSYEPNEKVILGLASLDSNGDTLCDSNLEITIKGPDGKETKLAAKDGEILKMNSCDESNNVTSNPDYTAYFFPTEEGFYKVKLTNLENGNEKETQFEVKKDLDFSIERDGATRINPFATDRYHMILKVTAKKDFKGKIVEKLPASFNIIWQGKSVVETEGNKKTITWEVDLKEGETKELIYEYQAPKNSPDFYELGKAQVFENEKKMFEEIRTWQIASDGITIYNYGICGSTCDTDSDWWASGDDVDQFPFGGNSANRNTHTEANDSQYSNLSTSNDVDYATTNPRSGDEVFAWFEMPITEDPSRIYNMDLTWEASLSQGFFYTTDATMYILRSGSNWANDASWDQIGGNTSMWWNIEYTKTESITSGFSNYIGSDDILTWGVYSNRSSVYQNIDYVEAEVGYYEDITGTVYTNEAKNTNIGAGKTVNLYINGSYIGTDETDSNGVFTFASYNMLDIGDGDVAVVYLDGETENGSTVLVADGTPRYDTTADIITDRVCLINREASGNVTNSDIDQIDSSDAENEDGVTISSGNLTVASGFELFIPLGETFAPGGNVTTDKLHIKGTYTGTSETLSLIGSGTGSCDSSAALTLPLCVDSGATFTPTSNTTIFTGSSNTTIENTTYYNLSFTPTITTGVNYTFDSGAVYVNGNFTVNPTSASSNTLTVNLAGTLDVASTGTITLSGNTSGTSTLDTINGSNHSINSGYLNIGTAGTLNARASTITFEGTSGTIFTRSGTFNQGTSTIVYSQTGGNTALTSGTITFYNLEVDMSGRTGTLGNTVTVQNDLDVIAGTLYDGGNQITGSSTGTLTLASGAFLSLGGTTTATSFPTLFTNPTINLDVDSTVIYRAGVPQIVSIIPTYGNLHFEPILAGNITYEIPTGIDVDGNLYIDPESSSAYTLTVNMTSDITMESGKTITVTGTDSANSILDTISGSDYSITSDYIVIGALGTIKANDSYINVHINWTCYGSLNAGTSTVYLNGSGAQTVTGETNFYNLDITTTTAKTVTFTQDAIVNILSGGNVNFEGASGNLLTLTSSSLAPWYLRLDPAATYSISYVNVSESNAGGYQTIYANDGTVTDGGLNINWVFAAPGTEILMNFNGINLNGVDIN